MQRIDGQFVFSATDLNNFLECRRLPELELLVALGKRTRPDVEDEHAELVRRKGEEHEARYLEALRLKHNEGEIVEIARPVRDLAAFAAAEAQTIAAMQRGARIIYQATFFDGQFVGHADFLQRVDGLPSKFGSYSYEAVDTKLALSTKPYFIMQLCNYSEHLERVQGAMPKVGRIVFGDGNTAEYKLKDYFAYYRHVKERFLTSVAHAVAGDITEPSTYPLENDHCSVCVWDVQCDAKRRTDDHLTLVAWMRRDQTVKLERLGITTVELLASAPDEARPSDMSRETFAKLRKQAQLQVRSRNDGAPLHELLANDPRAGFGLLPEPNVGDVYFDMEGDPLYEPRRGLEYLFGVQSAEGEYKAFWARNRAEEKRAFEKFIDFIVERRERNRAMHVYHYANYEKAALQRLSQQHSTRAREVDDLLRSEVLVDLYAVVRQAMMIGEESYSIKKLERFYGFSRATQVKKGDQSIVEFEKWRLSGDQKILDDIEAYNKDDCKSTQHLHEWLLVQREQAIARFGEIPFRPLKRPDEPCHDEYFEDCTKCLKRQQKKRHEERQSAIERELLADVVEPEDDDQYYAMAQAMRTRYLLGNALSYHRRESNPQWWEFFHRCENVDELKDLDQSAIGGLRLIDDVAPFKDSPRDKNLVYTYRFPPQRHKIEPGEAYDPVTRERAGIILRVDDDEGTLQLKSGLGIEAARAITALIPPKPLPTDSLEAALMRLAEAYRDGRLRERFRALADLLEKKPPRTTLAPNPQGEVVLQPDAITPDSVADIVRSLTSSYLFIQGPPGTGKTTIGSQVICDLLSAGKRVGVMSRNHKAMHHLLDKVEHCMAARGTSFAGRYKHTSEDSEYHSKLPTPFVISKGKNSELFDADYDLAAGTAWLFCCEELEGTFDYLFIDEAGQVSLADTLAASMCARNIVLLGDPSQLAQVSKGCHAPHCADSVLQHLLGRETTVPPTCGVFLDTSHRMHSEISQFVSDMVYDGRLHSAPAMNVQCVKSPGLQGAGLRSIFVEHEGNAASSIEEADRIVEEIGLLRQGTVGDHHRVERPLDDSDIIVVTPYNAQRRLIRSKLRTAGFNVAVGTVDKFQGQEAFVVFYSMATSDALDASRGVKFLMQTNRFNVAISRARALCVVTFCPRLLSMSCRSAEEMALANLLCAYTDAAQRV